MTATFNILQSHFELWLQNAENCSRVTADFKSCSHVTADLINCSHVIADFENCSLYTCRCNYKRVLTKIARNAIFLTKHNTSPAL